MINTYRILLVDDEPLVRLPIKSNGEWQKYGFDISCEACDGLDALDKLKSENVVDIIITDISMPKMNGIDLIKKVRETDKNIPIIVLSSFNDYQYVREAFMLGIQDYILKSDISFESLLKLLQKSAEQISSFKKTNEDTQNKNVLLKQRLLEDLLNGVVYEKIENKVKEYNVNISKKNITVSLFSVDDYKLMEEKYDPSVIANIGNSILNVFLQKMDEFNFGEVISVTKGNYVFITSFDKEKSLAAVFQKLSMLLDSIKYALSTLLNISVTIGVSDIKDGFGNLSALYSQAQAAADYKLIFGKGSFIFQHNLVGINYTSDVDLAARKKGLLEAVNNADEKGVKSEIKNIYLHIKNSNIKNINNIYSLYLELIYVVMGHLHEKGITSEELFNQNVNFVEKISKFETLDEINTFFDNMLQFLLSEIQFKSKDIPGNIKIAIKYINQHFSEEITLKSVSEHINISEAHFSRLFSSQIGESFISYLTKLRIEKAKQLLMHTNMTINEISESIGYINQEHFSRVFKKIVGYSPNKYRN